MKKYKKGDILFWCEPPLPVSFVILTKKNKSNGWWAIILYENDLSPFYTSGTIYFTNREISLYGKKIK